MWNPFQDRSKVLRGLCLGYIARFELDQIGDVEVVLLHRGAQWLGRKAIRYSTYLHIPLKASQEILIVVPGFLHLFAEFVVEQLRPDILVLFDKSPGQMMPGTDASIFAWVHRHGTEAYSGGTCASVTGSSVETPVCVGGGPRIESAPNSSRKGLKRPE